jgi:hypothetical protein
VIFERARVLKCWLQIGLARSFGWWVWEVTSMTDPTLSSF